MRQSDWRIARGQRSDFFEEIFGGGIRCHFGSSAIATGRNEPPEETERAVVAL